jgi:hypothetical protein
MNALDIIPDDSNHNNVNVNSYILDPLSVIIKLVIISNKPIGTKLRISNNMVYIQEPGPFQAFCRYFLKSNKTDIQYLYNPIEIACNTYLVKSVIDQNPKMKDLFKSAQNGLTKLIETYKNSSVMRICLNYYLSIISNHLDDKKDTGLFKKDDLSGFYSEEKMNKLFNVWNKDKLRIILNLTTFLSNDDSAETNVKSLETIMDGIDRQVYQILA